MIPDDDKLVENYIDKIYTFSSQDKLDWDNVIELLMKLAIFARGTKQHHKWVMRLESSVETNFSGVDIRTPIIENRERLQELGEIEQNKLIKECSDNIYYYPETMNDLTCKDRDIIKTKIYHWYWEQRFAFIRDLWAKHRGLIWGKKQTPGGKPMKREED